MNDLERTEHEDDSVHRGDHEDGRPRTFEITVSYNGLSKPLTVSSSDLIGSVLSQAIAIFGQPPNPHTLALYTDDGRELQDGQTVKEAGIKKREKLLLRPSTVKAG